jgi:hypothetical protein
MGDAHPWRPLDGRRYKRFAAATSRCSIEFNRGFLNEQLRLGNQDLSRKSRRHGGVAPAPQPHWKSLFSQRYFTVRVATALYRKCGDIANNCRGIAEK